MAKFMIECPHCNTLNQASTFILARKEIECGNCKEKINVKANRITSRVCPHCKNTILYDQAKMKNECPACHKEIGMGQGKLISFPCPQCSCVVQIDENASTTNCPVCDYYIDNVHREFSKSRLVSETGVSVIEYEGDNETFVWKHPIENFNMGSIIRVHESQEAVFFLNGQALDTLGPGQHIVSTENLPILSSVYKLPTDGIAPFHAEVYFINKTVQMNLKWGTDISERVRFIEPNSGIPLEIGASGQMNLQVDNSRKLLIKLVGTTNGIAWGNVKDNFTQSIKSAFRPMIMLCVKEKLSLAIKEEKINILEIDQHLGSLSKRLGDKVGEGFKEYGLIVRDFYVTNIALPEENKEFQDYKSLASGGYIKKKEQEVRAGIISAERQAELEIEKTKTERAKMQAERDLLEAQIKAEKDMLDAKAKAESTKMQGYAEAEVMTQKGYTQKDVMQLEAHKASAEAMGKMGSNINISGSGGSSVVSDMIGLSMGMKVAQNMGTQFESILGNTSNICSNDGVISNDNINSYWKCACGYEGNSGKFCSQCGKAKPELWTCLECGCNDNKGKFCAECGKIKPELWTCPECGVTDNKGKFCSECGAKKE